MTPFLFDVPSELRQQVRRVAFHSRKLYIPVFSFPSSVSLCLYVFLTLLLTMSVLVTLCFCWPPRVNGGRLHRFAPLAIRRVTRLRLRHLTAAFAQSFQAVEICVTKSHRRGGELNKNIGLVCQDMDAIIGTLTFNICSCRRLTGVKTHTHTHCYLCLFAHATGSYQADNLCISLPFACKVSLQTAS